MKIFDAFQRFYVVNLPERTDRRREMLAELATAGIAADDPRLRFFRAVRPEDAGPFPSLGSRGCYLSHLGILREALAEGLENVLVLEDDLAMEPAARDPQPQLLEVLREGRWDFAYPGHVEGCADPAAAPTWQTTDKPLACTHFYAVNRLVMPDLIAYLEACIERPPGHPDGGPMHVDGAFSMFRMRNPDRVTLICMPSLGGQRSSRSDIYPNQWFDLLPGFQQATGLARAVANHIRSAMRGGAGLKQG